jgi:hypothetical protein
MPKRKKAKTAFVVTEARQTVDPDFAARALEKMEVEAARLARRTKKYKGCRDTKLATPQ